MSIGYDQHKGHRKGISRRRQKIYNRLIVMKEYLNPKTVAEEFYTSEKTISRDINSFFKVAYPQYDIKKVTYRGNSVWKAYNLPHKSLDPLNEDDHNMISMLRSLVIEGNAHRRLLIEKFISKFTDLKYQLDFQKKGIKSENLLLIEKIEEAINFSYSINLPDEVNMIIYPYRLMKTEYGIFLAATNRSNDLIQFFPLEMLGNIRVLSETFEKNKLLVDKVKYAINHFFDSDKEPFEVIIHIQSNHNYIVRDIYFNATQTIAYEHDGSIYLSIYVSSVMELAWFLKKWSNVLTIVEPIIDIKSCL
jgi:predicted DNA-binding transcriptional regulator YafY